MATTAPAPATGSGSACASDPGSITIILEDGEASNGLAEMLAGVIEETTAVKKTARKMRRFRGSAVIELTDMDVAVTIAVDHGVVRVRNGKPKGSGKADCYMGADYITLADISAGKCKATTAMREKRLVTGGSLLKLMRFQRLLLLPKVEG